ncbi:hypothetical protein ACA910_016529 [Epithemia clementina (nom. ined.)]
MATSVTQQPPEAADSSGDAVVVRWGSADRDDAVRLAQEVIKPSYLVGEHGIIQEPFQRASPQEVQEWINLKQLLVAEDKTNQCLIGCVRAQVEHNYALPNNNDHNNNSNDSDAQNEASSKDQQEFCIAVVKLGCLAVHRNHQGKGVATKLVEAVESFAQSLLLEEAADKNNNSGSRPSPQRRAVVAVQLEILSPCHWVHTHKERVRSWFTHPSRGYKEEAVEEMTAGTALGVADVRLATDAKFVTYKKYFALNDL